LDDETKADPMTDDPKPRITPEEMERRRGHVRAAIADSRIEGMATSAAELVIFESYIRGEIEAGDLVTAYLKSQTAARFDDEQTSKPCSTKSPPPLPAPTTP
jgi:hypothetical protein